MSLRKLTVLLSAVFGVFAAAPAFAQFNPIMPGAIEDLADVQLRRQTNRACNDLAEQFPVGNTAPECAARHEACSDELFENVKAELAAAFEQCSQIGPIPSFQCLQGIRESGIIEAEKAKLADALEAACQPLPPPPAVDEGDDADDNGQIVADEVAAAQGGCTVTGLGGAEGNLLWTALGLLPLLGLRRKG